MQSKLVIETINDVKMNLGSTIMLRKSGKSKLDSEPPAITANSAQRKRLEDAVVMGQGDDRLPSTSKMMTDVAMVPSILMAGLRSAT